MAKNQASGKDAGKEKNQKIQVGAAVNTWITEEEWQSREHRVNQRIQDVKVCLGFINDSIDDYHLLLKAHSKQEHWDRYLSCDGLPRVHYPAEMRDFISELRNIVANDADADVNWLLAVDERSLLSQDVYQQDLSRATLEQTLRPKIGALYEKCVQRILSTLDRIEMLFACEFEVADILPERVLEIELVRNELNAEIDVLFDKLTYRIICAPNSHKTSFEGIWESYCYRSENYNFQLWWLKDVPIRLPYLDLPLVVANLGCVGVKAQIPFSVLVANLTLRCVHTFFDPYSVGAKSNEYLIEHSTAGLNAGLMDIEDCLVSEWLMQVNIMNQMISHMEQKILAYMEAMKEKEAKVVGMSKIEQAQHNKKVGVPKEPPMIPEGMFPDPYIKFLEDEEQEYLEFLQESLSPKNLNLEPDEINLRKYKILGGVYSMVLVRKPKHTDFEKFNVTLHENRRVVYTQEDVTAVIQRDQGSQASKKFKRRSDLRTNQQTSNNAEDLGLYLAEDELPYFHITFQLPAHLCRYGEPVACQFLHEEVEEEDESSIVTIDVEQVPKKRKTKHSTPRKRFIQKKLGLSIESHSIESHSISDIRRPHRSTIASKSATPRNIYRESVLNMLRLSSVRYTILPEVRLNNFPITQHALSSLQSYNIRRHCIPRILSSFKFPSEFKSERLEIQAARNNKLMRRARSTDIKSDEEKSEPEVFNFEKQENPERIFPVFDWRERILYEEEDEEDEDESSSNSEVAVKIINVDQINQAVKTQSLDEETTIYGTLKVLEDINDKYRAQSKQLYDQPEFIRHRPKDEVRLSFKDEQHAHTKSVVRISDTKFTPAIRSSRASQYSSEGEFESDNISSIFGGEGDLRQQWRRSRNSYRAEHRTEDIVERAKVKHWTTKYIRKAEFNREKMTCTIMTDRLGLFGFAYNRYMHFPFRNWCLKQNEENPNEIIFTIDTWYVLVHLFITNEGIRGYVTKSGSAYVAKPKMYMQIPEPISDYRELRKRFCEKNINIFAEKDACFYIDNGYFSEKHLATELHIYDAFAVHCKLIKFYRCDWNRLATRRNMLLCLRNPRDVNDGADVTVRVTPDNSTFVEVTELCSDDLDVIQLHFQPTWRNIGVYSDLHQLINSMYPQATDLRNREPKLIYYLRTLFTEVRPLSFS